MIDFNSIPKNQEERLNIFNSEDSVDIELTMHRGVRHFSCGNCHKIVEYTQYHWSPFITFPDGEKIRSIGKCPSCGVWNRVSLRDCFSDN